MYCVDSKLSWVDESRPIIDQFDEIAQYKINTRAIYFVTIQTQIFLQFLSYSYSLEFEQRPDYNRLRFLLKKVLMNMDVVPNIHFDWCVNLGNENQCRKPKK